MKSEVKFMNQQISKNGLKDILKNSKEIAINCFLSKKEQSSYDFAQYLYNHVNKQKYLINYEIIKPVVKKCV